MARTTVFIVGAGRSGTTYLQNLLGAHPLIATSQETDLFDRYVRPWRERWEQQLPPSGDEWLRWRHKGLPALLTEAEFDELLGDVIERVHAATLALKSGASVLLEKVPGYSLHGPLILRYLPDARFIHLIRDGRDVACSMVRASRGWGRGWAPSNVETAATQWRDHVVAARHIADATAHYTEARYERLCSPDGARALAELCAFCGVDATHAECEELLAATPSSLLWSGEVLARLGRPPEEPEGFAGEGGAGAWRGELRPRDRIVFERVAGPLLAELGYASPGWTGVGALRRVAELARLGAARRVARVRYRSGRVAAQVGR